MTELTRAVVVFFSTELLSITVVQSRIPKTLAGYIYLSLD